MRTLTALATAALAAQSAACIRPHSLEALAGPTFARPSIVDHGSLPVNTGVGGLAGARGSFPLTEPWTVQTEVRLVHERFASPELPTDTPVRLTSLSLPVLVGYAPGSGRVELVAGPQPSVLIRARRALRGEDQDIIDDFRPVDLSLVVGAGLRLDSGRRARVDVRYVLGLTDQDATNWYDTHQRTLEIVFGYRWWSPGGRP